MSRFEPYNTDNKYTTLWGVYGTHLVVYEPRKASVLKTFFKTRCNKLVSQSVPVAAFDLDKLIVDTSDASTPHAWNWTMGALNFLTALNTIGYIVVIFTNQQSMYVTPNSEYWKTTAFKSFYSRMERVFMSYRRNVSKDCPPFMYAAPSRPSQKRGRTFSSPSAHLEYRKPATGMWKEFEEALKSRIHTNTTVDMDRSFYVGSSYEDELFADSIGLKYTTKFPHFDESDNPVFKYDSPSSSGGTSESETSDTVNTRTPSRETTPGDEKEKTPGPTVV